MIIIFGVSGAGKTTVGKLLAHELGWHFLEADDFHPAANIEKMRSGYPLTDDDHLQSLCRLRDHAPTKPAERTTPFRATTSSRMRCARVELPTSAALAIFSFSIAGSRLWISSATTSYTGQCGPPPIKASIRIDGPGRPAARNTGYNSDPKCIRAPLALSVCLIHPRERS